MNITYNIYNMNVYIYLHTTSINMNIYIYTYYKYAVWRYRCWTCLVAPWSPWPLGTSKSIKSTWYLQNDAQICPNSRPMDTYGIFMHQHVLSMCWAMFAVFKHLSSVFKCQHPSQMNRSDLLYADLSCHRQPFPEGLKHRVIWGDWSIILLLILVTWWSC